MDNKGHPFLNRVRVPKPAPKSSNPVGYLISYVRKRIGVFFRVKEFIYIGYSCKR